LLLETEEKLGRAKEAFQQGLYADSIYHSYNVFVSAAKALLTSKEVPTNTQYGIIGDFDRTFTENGEFVMEHSFKETVLAINKNEPTESFASEYLSKAAEFLYKAFEYRKEATKDSVIEQVSM
jgi:sulfite reductase (ferredoxin)